MSSRTSNKALGCILFVIRKFVIRRVEFIFCFLPLLLISCGERERSVEENVFYVCSMDPQVMEKQPGMCPICKMPLSKIILTKEDLQGTSIKLNETQIKLANIKTDTVRPQIINEEKTFTGIIAVDENKIQQASARVAGRVEHLYVKNTGEKIETGQVLYDLYSEELISAEKEFLLSLKNKSAFGDNAAGYENMINAAKNKLILWGMSDKQIEQLKSDGEVKTSVPVFSTISGVVTNISVREGEYVDEGKIILEVADLSSLWVEGQLYPDDIQNLKEQTEVEITIPSVSDEKIPGKISFVNPELNTGSKINLIRIELANSKMIYQPGMMAYIMININKKKTLAVPANAVIRGEKSSLVWRQNPDGKFDFSMVTLGIQNKDYTEITSGIKAGNVVVTSGTYLLNSEFIFKKGTDPLTNKNKNMNVNMDMKMDKNMKMK